MKVLNKLAAIALVVGTSQVFASDSLSANWQPPEPESMQISAMEPMSLDEMSAVKGGMFYGPLKQNQVVIAMTGFVAATTTGIGSIFVRVGDLDRSFAVSDAIICQNGLALAGTLLGQSQISAGREDNRYLGAVDVGLAFGAGVGVAFLQKGCTLSLYAIQNQIKISRDKARAIIEKKDEKYKRTPLSGRKLLTAKFNEQDSWFKWALDSAQRDRDDLEILSNTLKSLKQQRADCKYTGLLYFTCAKKYDDFIAAAQIKIANNINEFKKNAVSAGRAQIERGNWIGLGDPDRNNLKDVTYDIN